MTVDIPFNHMSNMSSPCRKCQERKEGCHDRCLKYIDYKEQRIGQSRYISGYYTSEKGV